MDTFGYSFFVTKVFILILIATYANSAPTSHKPRINKDGWPNHIKLDESNWRNSCNLSSSNIHGHQIMLPNSLSKINLTAQTIESNINNTAENSELNIHKDTALLGHRYKEMPKFNKTWVPIKKFLREIHHNVQIYVGMFDALSSHWSFIETYRQNSSNRISKELRDFLDESKLLLCEIETALNVSSTKPTYITRQKMQAKISIMTRHINQTNSLFELDAFYAKKMFYKYVVGLSDYLRVEINRPPTTMRNKSMANKNKQEKAGRRKGTGKPKKGGGSKVPTDLNNSSVSSGNESVSQTRKGNLKRGKVSAEKNNSTKNLNKKNKSTEQKNRRKHAKNPKPAVQ